jgi:hypothetical protein
MIKSIKIPDNISLKSIKKNDVSLIILTDHSEKSEKRRLFFITKVNVFYNSRIVLSNKHIINIIRQGINDLNLWNKRKIVLKGVGSKVDLTKNILNIKVSNTSKWFTIPEDICVKISNSPVSITIWGGNSNLIDKFKNNILNSLPKKSIT